MNIRRKQKIDWYAGYFLIGLLLPFTRLFGVLLRRDHTLKEEPKRIVFVKLLGLGSLIVASDAIRAIRMQFPKTKLILLADKNIADGIGPFQLFDEVYPVDTENLAATSAGVSKFLFRAWGWKRLWVIDLEVYSKLTTVLALLTMARNRFGFYLSYVPFRRFLNTHNITFDPSAYLEDNYGNLSRQITGVPMPVFISPTRQGELGKPYIILNNTCSTLADVRKMSDTTFAGIIQWILEHTDYGVAVLGMAEDRSEINHLIGGRPELSGMRDRILNFAGMAENFPAYYSFLRDKGVCLVTIDSGPLHIARKLGLPTISVWGPTNPDNYLKIAPPEQDRHLYYYLGSPCSPCVHHFETLPCGGNNFCMKHVTAGAVIAKIRELLQHLAVPHPA